jgi:penicillin amidase
MMRLQTDVLAVPARTLAPLLATVRAADPETERARRMLLDWDHRLEPASVPAGIYVAWERRLQANVEAAVIPAHAREVIRSLSLSRVIRHLQAPDGRFGADPAAARDALLLASLHEAVAALRTRLGPDMDGWRYGQPAYKHVNIRHPLSAAVDPEMRRLLDVGTLPRGGYGHTPNATGGAENQAAGASFRIVATAGEWDRTMGTNTPGQSGNPEDPHYRDLFEPWATDRFFPAFYTRARIDSVASRVTLLVPVP